MTMDWLRDAIAADEEEALESISPCGSYALCILAQWKKKETCAPPLSTVLLLSQCEMYRNFTVTYWSSCTSQVFLGPCLSKVTEIARPLTQEVLCLANPRISEKLAGQQRGGGEVRVGVRLDVLETPSSIECACQVVSLSVLGRCPTAQWSELGGVS